MMCDRAKKYLFLVEFVLSPPPPNYHVDRILFSAHEAAHIYEMPARSFVMCVNLGIGDVYPSI